MNRKESNLLELALKEKTVDKSLLIKFYEMKCNEEKRTKLTILPIIIEELEKKFSDIFDCLSNHFECSIDEKNDFLNISLKRTIIRSDIGEDGYRNITGEFTVYKSSKYNVYILMSTENADFIKSALFAFIREIYPRAYPVNLSSNEMNNLFSNIIKKNENVSIIAHKAISYPHSGGAYIDHAHVPIQQIFDSAQEGSHYVDKIDFLVKIDDSNYYKGFLSRQGLYRFYFGNLPSFLKYIIESSCALGDMKNKLFTNKYQRFGERIKNELAINFSSDRFFSKQDNYRLLTALNAIPKSSLAIFHSNPYLHASITDYVDGSCFDIYIPKSNSIRIVPRFRASAASFQRIYSYIFKGFSEGDVEEIAEEGPISIFDVVR